ncbi:MAG: hypothetical protein H8Z69_03515 [Nanohaloarchaea archaeon]|nr:hypothetical protein [Candidatus Nanohaloarchaea archaeon]
MNKKVLTALAVLSLVAMSGSAAAQGNESSTVDVSVSSKVAVDVKPASLTYSDIGVGTQSTASDRNFKAVEVENIGSEYVDRVWVNSTSPSDSPFGSGSASQYDAGNFLQVKPANYSTKLSGDDKDFHYVNRKEFIANEDNNAQVPSYIQTDGQWTLAGSASTTDPTNVWVGRMRMGDSNYFFAIGSASSSCDTDNTGTPVMRIANTPQDDDQIGTVDFSNSGDDWTQYNITSSTTDYGLTGSGPTDINGVNLSLGTGASEVNRTYDVLTDCDDSNPHVIRTRYNAQAGDASDLTTDGVRTSYLLSSVGNSGGMLEPGNAVTINTAVEVPQGVAQGSVGQGKLTVLITADTSQTTN